MKIAVLSDIHANVFALEAVFDDIEKQGVDMSVNLGDILYGPIAPKATYDLLMTKDLITISGNQDRQIVEATPDEMAASPTMAFIHSDLGTKPIEWLKSLPFDCQLTDDVYLCHGTPENDLVYLLENVSMGMPNLRPVQEITNLLGNQDSSIVLCGHTHVPRTVLLPNGQVIVNPGSVGLQAYADDLPVRHSVQNYSAHARYATITRVNSSWKVCHHQIPYDVASAVAIAQKRGREDWAHCLATGRT